jgi:hypothetical protein
MSSPVSVYLSNMVEELSLSKKKLLGHNTTCMSACRANGGNIAVSPKSKRPRLRAYLCFCAALLIELATVLYTYFVLRHNHRLALKTGMSRLVDRLENSMSQTH